MELTASGVLPQSPYKARRYREAARFLLNAGEGRGREAPDAVRQAGKLKAKHKAKHKAGGGGNPSTRYLPRREG